MHLTPQQFDNKIKVELIVLLITPISNYQPVDSSELVPFHFTWKRCIVPHKRHPKMLFVKKIRDLLKVNSFLLYFILFLPLFHHQKSVTVNST